MQFTTGRETIFAGINRVLPGEMVVVRRGRIVERRRGDSAARWRAAAARRGRGDCPVGRRSYGKRPPAPALGRAVRRISLGRHRFDGGAHDDGAARRTPSQSVHDRLRRRATLRTSVQPRAPPLLRSGPSMSNSCLMKLISGSCCPKSSPRSTTRPPIMRSCRPGLLLARRMKPALK